MKKRMIGTVLAVLLLLLSGCGQRSENGVSVVRTADREEYRTVPVQKGDLALTEEVRVKYTAAGSEELSFEESGLYYGGFFVAVGDQVRKGDLLAQLDTGSLNQEIAEAEAARQAEERRLANTEELITLTNTLLEGRTPDAEERERLHRYETERTEAGDAIRVLDERIGDLSAQRETRSLRAGIDGTVTWIRERKDGETSVGGRVIIVVTDLERCAFSANVLHPEALDPDQSYQVRVSGNGYELKLADPETIGIEADAGNGKSEYTRVWFRTDAPTPELEDGAAGSFRLVVEERKDVVFVPKDTVTKVDGQDAVFVKDENGLAQVRKVRTGLITGTSVQILEGLSENDEVIRF